MLTKDDLQAIKSIIKIEVNPIAQDLREVKKDVTDIQRDLKEVRGRVKKIDKNVDVAIEMFNEDDVKLEKRVVKIEHHLGLPSKN